LFIVIAIIAATVIAVAIFLMKCQAFMIGIHVSLEWYMLLLAAPIKQERLIVLVWYFDNAGLERLKNKHRSGRPPEVSEETSTKIRKELSEIQSGWMAAKEVMNLIYERTGVKYHEVHI
jgi:hypothetical protein